MFEKLIEALIIPKKLKKAIRSTKYRSILLDKCGEKAFLDPEEKKFPVMDKKCRYVCGLIYAAYVRAKQWKHRKIAKKAKELFEKLDCKNVIKREIRNNNGE